MLDKTDLLTTKSNEPIKEAAKRRRNILTCLTKQFVQHFSVRMTPGKGALKGTKSIFIQWCACVYSQYSCPYVCKNERTLGL